MMIIEENWTASQRYYEESIRIEGDLSIET